MARIDALYLEDPCSGSRRMVDYLAREGIPISRDRARNLMSRMGLRAIYQKPRTTVPEDQAERFPFLVDLDAVTAVDQVWATDITYIPLQKGFLYLVAIVDLFSRTILSWKLSNSLDTEFCLDALEMALEGGRRPEIFHSDQGCQFTSGDFDAPPLCRSRPCESWWVWSCGNSLLSCLQGRTPLEGRVRPERVVLPTPTIGQDLRLRSCGK